MIYSVKADKPSFKSIEFAPGFNVVLAERTKESTKKDSRNGLGKSTLLEIIHFCLGANRGETLRNTQLDDWTFTVQLDLSGKKYTISRNTTLQNKIVIEGDSSDWPIRPEKDSKTGQQVISRRDWTRVLGVLMFGLQTSYPDLNYAPTFRSLISYFLRRNGRIGGFLNPFQQHKNQLEWDKQVHNAFLLDLGWEYASKCQVLKDRLKVADQIRQEAKAGILTEMLGSVGEVEAQKIRLESEIGEEGKRLSEFKLHPHYREIENEANKLTFRIHEWSNLNVSDKQLLEHYEQSIKQEIEAEPETVRRMFDEVGVVLPDAVTRKIGDVLSFHKQIVANRRGFLNAEMDRIRINIAKRDEQIAQYSNERAEKMLVLQKHGALDEYTQLNNMHQTKIARLKELNNRLENLKKFEEGKASIAVDQALLQQQASSDLSERKTQKEKAVLFFNSNSEALYEAPGVFSIDYTKTGFKFNVEIEREGSHGVGNMKILCYDLMLAQLWAAKKRAHMFLIHDSIIFAGVDERQTALALELAAKEAANKGFQYICTLNSDTLPTKDFSEKFYLEAFVKKTLTDATEDGGILGIRF